MPRIAVFGGTGYLASIIKNQNNIKKNKYVFFSRKKNQKNYINFFTKNENYNFLKNFDFILHLAGPSQNQLKRNKKLILKKNQLTAKICDLCLQYNIKLIYVSSMQVYRYYGKDNIYMGSKLNIKNLYSKSHHGSEKIILSKFINDKKMFTILRVGNVFGFKKYENQREIDDNLIHSLCNMALKNKKILIKNGSIRRTFVPSQIFMKTINSVVKRKFFKNSIINIFYKNYNLKDISQIIQKRSKLVLNLKVDIIIKKFYYNKNFTIYGNQNFKFTPIKNIVYKEIDQILKYIRIIT